MNSLKKSLLIKLSIAEWYDDILWLKLAKAIPQKIFLRSSISFHLPLRSKALLFTNYS